MYVFTHMLAQASNQWVQQTCKVVQWHPRCLCQHRAAQPTTSTQQTCATLHSPCQLPSSLLFSRYTNVWYFVLSKRDWNQKSTEGISNVWRTFKHRWWITWTGLTKQVS